jgi:glycosyltransferase involved in cell wall biosynthesis
MSELLTPGPSPAITVVVPVFNEEGGLKAFLHELGDELQNLGRSFEVILVDDGSSDGSTQLMRTFCSFEKAFRLIVLKRNFGQTAALMAGFDSARGDIVVAIDGDAQNDPADIEQLVRRLDDGFDAVSGWRFDRQDSGFTRRLPSALANRLISWASSLHLHDYGCTLKAYRRDVLADVRLYGEMHRFLPLYVSLEGGRVAEIKVNHRPRQFGKSKYGLNRTIKVLLDLLLVLFLWRFGHRPIYVFGTFGIANIVLAVPAGSYALWLKYGEGTPFIQTPMPLLVVLFIIVGMISVLMGLLAEMVMRTYYESQGKSVYRIRPEKD